MSLNACQIIETSKELKENYKISELTPVDVERDLCFNKNKLEETLNITSFSDGESVWRLRDYMESKILEQGKEPYPYSVLKVNRWYRYK